MSRLYHKFGVLIPEMMFIFSRKALFFQENKKFEEKFTFLRNNVLFPVNRPNSVLGAKKSNTI